jgi:hypothetical protein
VTSCCRHASILSFNQHSLLYGKALIQLNAIIRLEAELPPARYP